MLFFLLLLNSLKAWLRVLQKSSTKVLLCLKHINTSGWIVSTTFLKMLNNPVNSAKVFATFGTRVTNIFVVFRKRSSTIVQLFSERRWWDSRLQNPVERVNDEALLGVPGTFKANVLFAHGLCLKTIRKRKLLSILKIFSN